MELWIRSQDREDLVKANALYVMNNQIWNEVPFYENHKKLGLTVTGHNHKLAEYPTKEKALEVLNEIQEHLDYLNIGNINRVDEKGFRVCTIYQMPKE